MPSNTPSAGRHRVELPTWGRWLDLLDELGGGDDPERLLTAWLSACVRCPAPGALGENTPTIPLSREAVAELPAATADALAEQALAALAEQRSALAITTWDDPRGIRLETHGKAPLLLRPWTFGERARVLRLCLRRQGGGVTLDHARFERAEVLCCVRNAEVPGDDSDSALTERQIDAWPIPLGEAVTGLLQTLNEPAANEAEVLRQCASEGLDHPDLDLAECCRAFGWTPEQVEALPAAQLRRLLLAQRLLDTTAGPTSPSARAPHSGALAQALDEGLTRILVRDA